MGGGGAEQRCGGSPPVPAHGKSFLPGIARGSVAGEWNWHLFSLIIVSGHRDKEGGFCPLGGGILLWRGKEGCGGSTGNGRKLPEPVAGLCGLTDVHDVHRGGIGKSSTLVSQQAS